MTDKLIHKELSYQIVGCVFDVHNEVGPGLREECYQKAMEQRLGEKGIPYLAKPRTRRELIYRGVIADVFEPDLVVADKIIAELKHQAEGFAPENVSQVISYLKCWNLDLGLLVNFAMDSAIVERIPHQPGEPTLDEDYEHIADLIQPHHRPVLRTLREGLLQVYREVGLGYPATTYRALVQIECQATGLSCVGEIVVEPAFHERRLPKSQISPFVVNGLVCVQVDAISDSVSARAIRTMQTHLRLTGCEVGLVACFGRSKFTIRGVRR
jgi:GxxExxY protein